jgi:hypothetical protein
MVNFRLAFDTRAQKLLDGLDKRTDRDSEVSNITEISNDFCAALRHHAANAGEMLKLRESARETLGGSLG